MKKLCWLLLLYLPTLLQAQTPKPKIPREPSTTRYLKDMYLYVKDKARKNQYYINEFSVNTHALLWKDNSTSQKSYIFYYSFLGDDTPLLRLAVLTEKQGDTEIRTEFLYDQDGNMGLCFEKQNLEKLAYREMTVFYEKDLCINLILDKEVIDPRNSKPHQAKVEKFKKLAKEVYQKFTQDQANLEN